jgi:hypothetical protein
MLIVESTNLNFPKLHSQRLHLSYSPFHLKLSHNDVSHSRLEQIAKVMEISVLDLLSFGEKVANYFAHSSHFVNGNGNLYTDGREVIHELEKTELENEKLRLEVRYWQEKWENSQRVAG